MTEMEHIEAVQDALGQIKKHLRAIEKINTEAGRLEAANVAMKSRGEIIALHADMMTRLRENWPEETSTLVQVRGGGGRG